MLSKLSVPTISYKKLWFHDREKPINKKNNICFLWEPKKKRIHDAGEMLLLNRN